MMNSNENVFDVDWSSDFEGMNTWENYSLSM